MSTREKPFPNDPDWLMQSMRPPLRGTGTVLVAQSRHMAPEPGTQYPSTLNDEYSAVFTEIVQGETLDATLGKAILATAVHFLLTADYDLDQGLLTSQVPKIRRMATMPQAMWQSFTYVAYLNPQLAELMEESFPWCGSQNRHAIFPSQKLRNQFIRQYSTMVVYYVEDPLTEWIPTLFTARLAQLKTAGNSPRWIGSIIRGMEDTPTKRVMATLSRTLLEGPFRLGFHRTSP